MKIKITVEPDEKPFTKAAEAILENYDASRKFIEFQKTEKSGGPGFLTLSFVVRRLRELRDAHKTQRIGGSATNVATTLHEFARERTSDSDADTLKVIARGGTQKKRSLFSKNV
jgi:hypothetical protein